MTTEEKLSVEVFRYDPDKDKEPRYQLFRIPLEQNMSVLRCLEYIRKEIDGGLAFRGICKVGICGLCLVRVNGKIRLACKSIINKKRHIKIEPVDKHRVVRDLVVIEPSKEH